MSFWRRWFGRPDPAPPPPPPAPAAASGGWSEAFRLPPTPPPGTARLGNTTLLSLPNVNGATVLLDLDTFDFHYGEERRKRPDPSQRDLDELLPTVTRVRVRAGGMLDGAALLWPVLLDTSDPAAVAALRTCFVLAPPAAPSGYGHCGCLGGPTLELFAGDALAASISIQHKAAIRWSRWRPDAPLGSGPALERWLVDHGLDAELLEVLSHNPFAMAPIPTGGSDAPLTAARQKLFLARLLEKRAPPAALAACTEAVRLDPALTDASVLRSAIRQATGDGPGALADLDAALEQLGPHAELLFRRGVLLDRLARPDEAVETLDRALAVDPSHVNALHSRGVVRMNHGDLDAALEDLTRAIALAPEWDLPYVNRGMVHLRRDDRASALADHTAAIERMAEADRPEQRATLAILYGNRASLLAGIGETARAEADRREAARLSSPSSQERSNLLVTSDRITFPGPR